ncbi:helix-turn-helix transcriptional regulator [Paenibacillus arenilitoris]|uniref:Helix-turn-helix transcriptional regulator n=1 Tax=Paenibacillus arenilitoris TaxID=2772299 RepID=A0A927H7P0_9BACL|nr:AraC family transcriptional regulator [Paenibacillus arenilitoris]MBD2871831.1 helix-turn-helix transcriptional regulator [Paenibacillus arenilitoris]
MNHPVQLFVDSLRIEFLHIRTYELDYNWRIASVKLPQSVFWYVTGGRVHAIVDGTGYMAGAGELLHLPSGSMLSARPVTDRVTLVSLNFAAEVAFMPDRSWHELLRFPVRFRDGAVPPAVPDLLREMAATAEHGGIARSMLLRAGMIRLIGLMLDRYLEDPSGDAFLSADSRINGAVAFLAQNPGWPPSVAELAELVQLSESHLRKLFLRHVGMPPLPFIHRMKVEQAKRLLAEGGERISAVSLRLGIQDPNYFARLFKQHTGLSPKDYRERNRNWMGGE